MPRKWAVDSEHDDPPLGQKCVSYDADTGEHVYRSLEMSNQAIYERNRARFVSSPLSHVRPQPLMGSVTTPQPAPYQQAYPSPTSPSRRDNPQVPVRNVHQIHRKPVPGAGRDSLRQLEPEKSNLSNGLLIPPQRSLTLRAHQPTASIEPHEQETVYMSGGLASPVSPLRTFSEILDVHYPETSPKRQQERKQEKSNLFSRLVSPLRRSQTLRPRVPYDHVEKPQREQETPYMSSGPAYPLHRSQTSYTRSPSKVLGNLEKLEQEIKNMNKRTPTPLHRSQTFRPQATTAGQGELLSPSAVYKLQNQPVHMAEWLREQWTRELSGQLLEPQRQEIPEDEVILALANEQAPDASRQEKNKL